MTESLRVLVISDDDDLTGPLAAILRRAGHRVGVNGTTGGIVDLQGTTPPDALFLDHDISPGPRTMILDLLEPHAGPTSFPLLILGGGPSPTVPRGWHEDAWMSLGRPPAATEVLAGLSALKRLAFYRPYRDLVHSLSQPFTTLHALSGTLSKTSPADEAARRTIERLGVEAEKLMSLMEEFQRTRAAIKS